MKKTYTYRLSDEVVGRIKGRAKELGSSDAGAIEDAFGGGESKPKRPPEPPIPPVVVKPAPKPVAPAPAIQRDYSVNFLKK